MLHLASSWYSNFYTNHRSMFPAEICLSFMLREQFLSGLKHCSLLLTKTNEKLGMKISVLLVQVPSGALLMQVKRRRHMSSKILSRTKVRNSQPNQSQFLWNPFDFGFWLFLTQLWRYEFLPYQRGCCTGCNGPLVTRF